MRINEGDHVVFNRDGSELSGRVIWVTNGLVSVYVLKHEAIYNLEEADVREVDR